MASGMRVSSNTFICGFCDTRTVPPTLENISDVVNVTVEKRDDGQVLVVLNLQGGRSLEHPCEQVPAELLAELEEV